MSERHVFRFFVDEALEAGKRVDLDDFDARHARVLHRAHADQPVEVVDGDGVAWHGTFDGPNATLTILDRVGMLHEPVIVVYAFARVGGKFDELVDGAVQAGATRIVPVVVADRDRERIDARRDRLMRIATTAAKQAKRASVPLVHVAIAPSDLLDREPGVVLDPAADDRLDEVLAGTGGVPTRLLVGGPDGFPTGLVDELAGRGWRRGRLGPSILRSELAAPVAVAIAAMLAPRA